MSGSLSATASNASLLDGTGSVGFTTTGSFTTMSGSVSTRVSQIESVYATTGSNSFRATQSITGSLTVTGQIIAQTLNVQQVTSSIIYSSGSNVFGCDINSRQVFTGSFYQTGSVAIFSNTVCVPVSHVSNNIQIGYGGAPAGTGKLFISRGDQYGLNINAQSGYVRIQGDDDLLAINRGGVDILSMNTCNHLGIRTTASPFAALRVCQCANNNDYAVRIQAVFGVNDYLDSDANRIFGGGLSETQFLNGSSSRPAMISLGGNLATSEALGVINFFRSDNASTYRSRAQIWAATNGSGCSTTLGGYLTFTTADTEQTNPTQKLTISSNGTSCFACTVCAYSFASPTPSLTRNNLNIDRATKVIASFNATASGARWLRVGCFNARTTYLMSFGTTGNYYTPGSTTFLMFRDWGNGFFTSTLGKLGEQYVTCARFQSDNVGDTYALEVWMNSITADQLNGVLLYSAATLAGNPDNILMCLGSYGTSLSNAANTSTAISL
jgi:hypothetical protein